MGATASPDPDPTPDDLLLAARCCRDTLLPALEADWSVPAGDLTWSCRRTLDHIPDALTSYAVHLATRSPRRLPRSRDGAPAAPVADLLEVVGATAAVLAEVARAAPPAARGFHSAGLADAAGFLAMGCVEVLIHTADIAQGLGLPFRPPDGPTGRALRRIFPWAPADADPWAALRWAAGRAALPDRPRLAPDWSWHCAPLAEWDGTVKTRPAPPAGT